MIARVTLRILCVLSVLVAWTAPSQADTLFSENFESYAVGSSLVGQGGWSGGFVVGNAVDPLLIASNLPMPSQFANGHFDVGTSTGNFSTYSHLLPHNLDTNQITTLLFDGYAYSDSNNAILGLNGTNVNWVVNSDHSGNFWEFDARGITGNNANLIAVPGGIGKIVHLGIVVDGTTDTVYGMYDYGSGVQTTAAFSVTPTAISSLNLVDMWMDHRTGNDVFGNPFNGAAFDNISITSASAVPEPAVWQLSAVFGFGGLCVWRLRRQKR